MGQAQAWASPARVGAVVKARAKRGQSRWVGFLYCLACESELREVMADEANDTYLLDGGDRVRATRVPCRDCGAEREFRSQHVRPMPPENIVDIRRKVP